MKGPFHNRVQGGRLVLLAATLVVSAGFAPASRATELFPEDVSRVVFLGDSITYGGYYVTDIVAYQRTREPDRKIECINAGLSSETVSGLSEPRHAGGKFPRPDLHERLARILEKTKPDLVIACYGINDGIYLPFDEKRFQSFKDGMTRFHNAVVKNGTSIIHITPPIFDEVKAGHVGYAGVLDIYSEWLMQQRTNGWRVIDLHTPMRQKLAEERVKNPSFAFGHDGVHPDESGHWFMAKVILGSLGANDVAGLTNASALFGDNPDAQAILRSLHQQQAIMKDAWLTEIGHKRPQKAGLPMPEAQKQAAELEREIQTLLSSAK